MRDSELEAIRQKKLRGLLNRIDKKENQHENVKPDVVLNRIFKDRAWEIYNSASYQFPEAMHKIRDLLVKLVSTGKITSVSGEDLYFFLRKVGLDVRLSTKITYASHGQLKSLEEKMKEDLQKGWQKDSHV